MMDKLSLKIFPHSALRKKAEPCVDFEPLRKISKEMISIMRENDGGGLAATQVAVPLRLFVMSGTEHRENPEVFINPTITASSTERQILEEGCLSLPGVSHNVSRPLKVTVRYFTLDKEEKEAVFTGYEASCVQHEIDHLDGIVYPDRIPAFKQKSFWKKYYSLLKKGSQ